MEKVKKFGPNLSVEVVEAFDEWCRRKGAVRGRAAEAALHMFMIAPADLRELATQQELEELRVALEEAARKVAADRIVQMGKAKKRGRR